MSIFYGGEKMNNNKNTDKIDKGKINNETLEDIRDSLKDISESLRPKPKKPNYGIAIAWIVIGVFLLYMLYQLNAFFKL